MENQPPIRARTEEERVAYVQGYAKALIDVHDRGPKSALAWLLLMVEMEPGMSDLAEKLRELS